MANLLVSLLLVTNSYDPALIYGRTKQQPVTPFRPHYVLFDKKTLKFMGFFRQHVPESRVEHYRIRYVNLFFFLEDDTITVIEPVVKVDLWSCHACRAMGDEKDFSLLLAELWIVAGQVGETWQNC